MNAGFIKDCLAKKHEGEAFFDEVKNGPSMSSELRIMDAVAILPTWSPVTIVGYEIKTARSDFLNDTKWPEYLKLCHQFVWVCPKGLIKKEEVDQTAGLMYCTDNGKLLTQKRSVYRNIEIPSRMLLYLLLWRGDRKNPQIRNDILREMAENKELGDRYRRYVSKKLMDAAQLLATKVRYEESDTLKRIQELGISEWDIPGLLLAAKKLQSIEQAEIDIKGAYLRASRILESVKAGIEGVVNGE